MSHGVPEDRLRCLARGLKFAFVSHTADRTTFKVGSHHYARELALAGADVLHISTPYSRTTDLFRNDARRSLARGGVWKDPASGASHFVPARWLPARITQRWISLANEIDILGFRNADWVIVDQPLLHNALDWFGGKTRFCYRPTDIYELSSQAPYANGQANLLRRADAVVATSRPVLEHLGTTGSVPSTVIENGVDVRRYRIAARTAGRRNGAVYVGALDTRFDWDALATMATVVADEWQEPLAVAGPIPRASRYPLPGQIDYLGTVAYEDVPALLSSFRVGLMPFLDSTLNRGRSPMKMYEYIAAGLAVVAPGFALRPAGGLAGRVHAYNSLGEVPAALASALNSREDPGVDEALQRLDWRHKATELLEFLASVTR